MTRCSAGGLDGLLTTAEHRSERGRRRGRDEARLDVRVLGRLEVCDDDGAPLPLGSPLQRALLALLLLEPGKVRSDAWLIEQLWAETRPPGSPLASLPPSAARPRRALRRRDGTARLGRAGPGYRGDVHPDEVDATRFVSL